MKDRDFILRQLGRCIWCGAKIRNVNVDAWMPSYCSKACALRHEAFNKFIGDLDYFIRLRPEGGGW